MSPIAVVLSGCGRFDGSEIHESVLTLLRLADRGASYQCLAPDVPQKHVINHLTQEVMENESRHVMLESARISRGEVKNIAEANPENFDALIFPGGYGAAKNICDFAFKGNDCTIQKDVQHFANAIKEQGKPIGFMCITPVMIPLLIGEGSICTIGSDPETASAIEAMGGSHKDCAIDDIVIDERNRVVSTPAYMLPGTISEVAKGIFKLVDKVLEMADS